MTIERRPTDDLQPGEHDADTLVPKIDLSKRFKVWYINREKKDAHEIITSTDAFSARAQAMLTIKDIDYVVRATEIN